MTNIIKLNEVRPEVIKLQLFPFFTERCGSNMVLFIASGISEHLGKVGGGLYEQIFSSGSNC